MKTKHGSSDQVVGLGRTTKVKNNLTVEDIKDLGSEKSHVGVLTSI